MEENKNLEQNNIEESNINSSFNGTFHEKDKLSENNIVKEVQDSFLSYSMSVITSRALPDLRDGLKPDRKSTRLNSSHTS